MKTLALKLLPLALISFLLFSCAKEDDGIYFDETAEVIDTVNVTYSDIELEILDLVNAHRAELGMKALNSLDIVSGVADGHTNYMIEVGQINHDNFGERAQILMKNAKAKTVAENVAYGYSTAQGALNGWLNSDAHRKVIENPNFTHFGISTKSDNNGRNYFTQIFINK